MVNNGPGASNVPLVFLSSLSRKHYPNSESP